MTADPTPHADPVRRWLPWARRLLWAAVIGASLAVFAWYRSPSFMTDLAQRLWSCF